MIIIMPRHEMRVSNHRTCGLNTRSWDA